MQRDGPADTDRERNCSALCLACGLCCNGVLHARVKVEPEHLPLIRKLGLRIEEFEDRSVGFRQPCALYQHDRCSVYLHHPPSCKAYRCALLRKYEDEDVTLDEALAIVHQAKELLRGDSWEMLRLELLQNRAANGALALRAAALDVLLQRHFGWSRETVPARK